MGICRGGGSSKVGGASTESKLAEVFASFAPSQRHPDGEPLVTKRGDEYHYERTVPNVDDRPIDQSSDDWKAVARTLNMFAAVNSDGSVTVRPEGLYTRRRTFKSPEAFRADVEKRLQSARERFQHDLDRLRAGRLTRSEAENIKAAARKGSRSMASMKINQMLADSIMTARMGAQIASLGLSRLDGIVDRMKAAKAKK